MKKNIIYLTGFMGTGKSAVSKRLSSNVGYRCCDTDSLIVKKTGKSIANIFDEHGEQYFRILERQVIQELDKDSNMVVALGGGAITWGDNLSYLKQTGTLIALMATPDEILSRTSISKTVRPLIDCDNPLDKIVSLMQARAYYYIMSDIMIDTNNKTIKEVTQEIIKAL